MSRSTPIGEYVLCAIFAVLGVAWVIIASRMTFWEGFAPQSGFLPFVYGAALIALSGATLASLVTAREAPTYEDAAIKESLRKPFSIFAAFAVAVLGLEVTGFVIAVGLMLLFMFIVIERQPLIPSLLAAAGTTAALVLIFRTWLTVPLPIGPLGF